MNWRALVCLLMLFPFAAWADVGCEDVTYQGRSYSICKVDPRQDQLDLFLRRPDGTAHASFSSVDETLKQEGRKLSFAMNAGMYHSDRSPVGLYVEDGKQVQRLITSAGPGNFGLLPNGVFCLRDGRADVFETLRFQDLNLNCRSATQSGPMLVIDGALHPRFLPNSTSKYIRNGVGTREDGQNVIFAISNERVTFHEFGSLFRDFLQTPNALYFDGNISRLYAPQLGRADFGFALGPIIGVVAPAP